MDRRIAAYQSSVLERSCKVADRKILVACFSILICIVPLALSACATRPDPPVPEARVETAATLTKEPDPATSLPVEEVRLPLPKTTEITDKINRVYQGTVMVNSDVNPGFVVGDFNGDFSQDIAVVVKPVAGRLEDINSQFANWMIRDPMAASNDTGEQAQEVRLDSSPIRIEAFDHLLVVIHGYESSGWRAPEATQTYLLKNVVGAGVKSQPLKSVVKANRGKNIPYLRGDVIEQVLNGEQGFLYYTGVEYGWYDRRARKNNDPRQMAHDRR